MGRKAGSKNVSNKTAEKVKQVEDNLEVIDIDQIIEDDNKSVARNEISTPVVDSKPDIEPVTEKPKTRFDDTKYLLLAKDVHRLYAPNMPYENLEILLRWYFIKCNLYMPTITRYWIDRFLQELPYLNIDIVKKMLENEHLL